MKNKIKIKAPRIAICKYLKDEVYVLVPKTTKSLVVKRGEEEFRIYIFGKN